MRLTYFLGNGFDIQCGLQSSYKEVMESYFLNCNTKFSKITKEHVKHLTDYWFDYELAISKDAKNYGSISELCECVIDFKKYLREYLKK